MQCFLVHEYPFICFQFKNTVQLRNLVSFNLYLHLPGQYHAGYQEQMSQWPEQPVNIIIKWLKDHSPSLIVADFGCGKNLKI